ncbi:DUF309 domain-containing protein [Telmatobacter bradus]|uniref:DUF309 domain-containing protein n=1 Tax=Telmatobacter bradus TaxID=474953 RepID=UPI003B435B02
MEFDWSAGALAQGLACYSRAEFFEAHEYWEACWKRAEGGNRVLLQALVQLAVAMCHHQRGNRVGTRALLRKSLERLENCPEALGEVNVQRLRKEVHSWMRWLDAEESAAPPSVPEILAPIQIPPSDAP